MENMDWLRLLLGECALEWHSVRMQLGRTVGEWEMLCHRRSQGVGDGSLRLSQWVCLEWQFMHPRFAPTLTECKGTLILTWYYHFGCVLSHGDKEMIGMPRHKECCTFMLGQAARWQQESRMIPSSIHERA
jgi:hypothetical protein